MPNQPTVYVLLINWHGWRDTIECLESLFRQEYPSFRAVVCNNDPADDSLERIREWANGAVPELVTPESLRPSGAPVPKPIPTVTIDRAAAEAGQADARLVLIETGDNLGFAGGNNVGLRFGLRRGDADYFWLLNNDTVVDPHALRHMVELAESRPDAGIVGSRVLHYDRSDVIQTAAGGRVRAWRGLTTHFGEDEKDGESWNGVFEPDYVTGASLLVKRRTVEEIGLLDERYFLYSEEVDWCLRAREGGWKLLYSPESRVWHKGGLSVRYGSPLHDYYTVRSMLLLVQKFNPLLLPLTFAYSLYRCLAPKLIRLQFDRMSAVLLAYRDFMRMLVSPEALADPPRPAFGSPGSGTAG